jgi:SAM-dependent methyltransferase
MHLSALRNWLVRLRQGAEGPLTPVAGPAPVGGPAVAAEAAPEAASHPATLWPPARLGIEEELWGTGFLTPGGGPEVLRLAAPIGLTAASSLLLLGVGPGGPAQFLATEMGVWVNGHEADPDLAAIAARRIQRAGAAMAKRASVAGWNRHEPAFAPRASHHALALDAIRDAPVVPVLAAIAQALKPHGQVAIAAWCRLEGRVPVLPQPEPITRGLSRLGFDVRVAEDVSARHMRLAVLGWRHLVRQMARDRPAPERAAAVVAQAELWTRRIRLMHAGRIRMMRWHAIGGSALG